MANKFPYVSSSGGLIKTIEALRRSFPKQVTAETLRKLGVAPKNESYVINVLRFLSVIDEEGNKVADKTAAFHKNPEAFAKEFEGLVQDAYAEVFELQGPSAWTLDKAALIQFFRTTDRSSELVGTRQASTFQNLAALAGHAELPTIRGEGAPRRSQAAKPSSKREPAAKPKREQVGGSGGPGDRSQRTFGLTVRIEVNLPASGDQETYDRIFQSIRKNFIDA